MIQHAQRVQRHVRWNPRARRPACQHVLQPVVPVRRLLAHPVQLALLHPAKPVRPEAQQVAVERVLRRAAVHHEPNVDDMSPNSVRRVRSLGMRRRLHKLHLVLLWVQHLKPLAAVRALRHRRRSLPSLRGKVFAHPVRTRHVPSRVIQPVDARARRQRQHLYKLRRAQRIAHARRVLRVRLLRRANDVAIVVLRGRRIRCVLGQVRDSRNLGSRGSSLRGSGKRKRGHKQSNRQFPIHPAPQSRSRDNNKTICHVV